jgi:hypothetical protein
MPSDVFPDQDALFLDMATNFETKLSAAPADYGETAPTALLVTNALTAFQAAYDANVVAQADAESARQDKDTARAALEAVMRPMIGRMQNSPDVDDAERESLGIRVYDTTRTPVSAPTTRPEAEIDTSQRFEHRISFRDEFATTRAKPAGVAFCELRVKIGGAPPAGPAECTFVATDSKAPYTYEFEPADANQTAHWMMRWVSTRNEPGPWSETVSATIPG